MKTDNLENELRDLKFTHLSESELVAYCDQELDQVYRARVEAHLKRCFICESQLELLREESAALSNREITADDVELVERLMEQMGLAEKPIGDTPIEVMKDVSLQERLAKYLQQMVANWRIYFRPEAVRRGDEGEEIWRWESEDGRLQVRAIMEKNANLTIHFSSKEIDLEGARLKVRLGLLSQEITLRRVFESEVHAEVAVPRRQRPRNMADISIEII